MSLKRLGQSMLRRIGLYNRLKASVIYDAYFSVANPAVLRKRSSEVSFYRRHLRGLTPGALIFDVGANHGQKVDVFLRLGARVVAVEPDESNQRILREKYCQGRLKKKPLSIVGKAASDTPGVVEMFVDAPGSAKNTLSPKWVDTLRADGQRFGEKLNFENRRKVETTTLDALIAAHGKPFFVKIDVEGHEPSVLKGLHQPVPYISFEVNLPEFFNEGSECISLLEKLSASGTFNIAPQCEGDLHSERWFSADECQAFLRQTQLPSVEIFWRSGA